jgi:SAM-dependent methyltransferase
MHSSSIQNMKKALSLIELKKNLSVLDIGGRGLKGDRSYKSLLIDRSNEYHIADIVAGEDVTHVMPSEYTIPSEDNYYDIIVSGQTLEHVKNPFRLVTEIKRVVKFDGFIIIIAPSAGPRHDVRDCWRFMDDAFKAIAEECELKIIANWVDRESTEKDSMKWNDHVFVGQKL